MCFFQRRLRSFMRLLFLYIRKGSPDGRRQLLLELCLKDVIFCTLGEDFDSEVIHNGSGDQNKRNFGAFPFCLS